MIRIAITQAAFEAIAATLPLGSVSFENAFNERGERYVWLPPNVFDRLAEQTLERLGLADDRDGALRTPRVAPLGMDNAPACQLSSASRLQRDRNQHNDRPRGGAR